MRTISERKGTVVEIENVPVHKSARRSEAFRTELIETLKVMEIDQSVVIDKCDSNIRTLVWVVNKVMGRRYCIRTMEDRKTRIGRVE
jgi:hypothetical protein